MAVTFFGPKCPHCQYKHAMPIPRGYCQRCRKNINDTVHKPPTDVVSPYLIERLNNLYRYVDSTGRG